MVFEQMLLILGLVFKIWIIDYVLIGRESLVSHFKREFDYQSSFIKLGEAFRVVAHFVVSLLMTLHINILFSYVEIAVLFLIAVLKGTMIVRLGFTWPRHRNHYELLQINSLFIHLTYVILGSYFFLFEKVGR